MGTTPIGKLEIALQEIVSEIGCQLGGAKPRDHKKVLRMLRETYEKFAHEKFVEDGTRGE